MPASRHPDLPTSTFEQRLIQRQLVLVCEGSPQALRGGIVVGALIAWLVTSGSGLGAALCWFGVLALVSLARTWLQRHYARHAATLSAERWVRIVLAGIAVNGFVWGVPSLWLIPPDAPSQTVLAILIVGVSATALATLTMMRYAYAAFLLPMMLPIAISYAFVDDSFRLVAIGIVMYVVAMLGVGRRHHKAFSDLMRLQLDLEEQIKRREQTEAELRIAKSEAEEASRAKSQFLANMSHELRTPLNGILGMSELLIRTTSGKQLKYSETVRNAGMRLLRIITDILDMSRMEAGALRVAGSEFAPRTLTNDVIELLHSTASKKGLHVTAVCDASVPDRLVSDAGRIQQVLSNLVDNAIKFTEHGAVELSITARDRSDGTVLLRWDVRDSGPGIPAHARAKLFQPFSQLDDSATRKHGGAGLGLAICRQLVEALGGTIGLQSGESGGSDFWFEVPCEFAKSHDNGVPNTSESPSPRGGRVLIVEDNPINRELAAEMLQAAGCTVETATNGEEALARLTAHDFDLALMDWHMPVMDGLTATRRLREYEHAQGKPRLPVVALTASVLPGDREACAAAGMDDFVAKPFTYEDISSLLARWIPARTSTVDA